jgi:AcrR family transcriptional regulator
MAAVAERAGVAAGTIYVHYGSKDELILATHHEVKQELGQAAATINPADPPAERFSLLWRSIYGHLAHDPDRARFLVQIECSPYSVALHAEGAAAPEDELRRVAAASDLAPLLVDLPLEVIYELGIGPAVRLAAHPGQTLDEASLERLATACWRAITKP